MCCTYDHEQCLHSQYSFCGKDISQSLWEHPSLSREQLGHQQILILVDEGQIFFTQCFSVLISLPKSLTTAGAFAGNRFSKQGKAWGKATHLHICGGTA